jgi:hypothetical protein
MVGQVVIFNMHLRKCKLQKLQVRHLMIANPFGATLMAIWLCNNHPVRVG